MCGAIDFEANETGFREVGNLRCMRTHCGMDDELISARCEWRRCALWSELVLGWPEHRFYGSGERNERGNLCHQRKGGVPRRLTTHPAEDRWPYWSHDGKWIYYASTRTGREEIWRMSSNGGEAVQITHNSGDTPQESPDGKFVYYAKGYPDT